MRLYLLFILLATNLSISFAQNVGIGTNNPDASAKLEVNYNNSGFLPPSMTSAECNANQNPAAGLVSYTVHSKRGEWQENNGLDWFEIYGTIASDPLPPVDTIIPSITIGTQIWSSRNLDVTRYRNGDPIPQITDTIQWANLTSGAWCWYNNDSATYAAAHGRLYNWYAVNDPRGLAPQGWHVPTERDWNRFVKFIDPDADTICHICCQSTTAGGAMKSTKGWNAPNTGATNSSGFAGLPSSIRGVLGFFGSDGIQGFWWSAGEFDTESAWCRSLRNFSTKVYRDHYNKTYGFSVRIVKD